MNRRCLVLFFALLVLMFPLASFAAVFDEEFDKLTGDINALPAVQLQNPFMAKVSAARAAATRGQPCTSMNNLDALRNQIDAKTSSGDASNGKPLTRSMAARLEADITAVAAALLGMPEAARCGGAASAPITGNAPVFEVVSNTIDGMQLHVSFPKARFTLRSGNGRPFTDVSMDGVGDGSSIGEPHIPRLTRFFAVPVGADVSVDVVGTSSYTLPAVDLWPLQEEAVDQEQTFDPFGDKPFVIDDKLYSANAFYPVRPSGAATLGMMRDLRIGGVETDGVQYNPVSKSLRVYTSLDLKLTFGGKNARFFADSRACNVYNLTYGRLYATLLNRAILCGYLEPTTFDHCGEEVMIITSPALRPAAETLATARRAAGYVVGVYETGNGRSGIGATNTEIQAFTRSALNSRCVIRPSYLILFGDTANVPTFDVSCPNSTAVCVASDLPYAQNGVGTDLFADAAYGRISAPDLATATTIVNKIVTYETTAPAPGGDDFYSHATITSFFEGAGPQDQRGFSRTTETIHDAMINRGYNVDRIYYASPGANIQTYYTGEAIPSYLQRPGFPWNGTTADMIGAINGGRFLFFHRDHGSHDGWYNPELFLGNVPSLTNGAKLPVIFGIDCSSGRFDIPGNPSFIEKMVQSPVGGAVGGFGDTRDSPTWANNHMALGFFDALFPNVVPTFGATNSLTRMGDVLLAGKQYMATQDGLDGQGAGDTFMEHYLFHYIGDPTMQIWGRFPLRFNIDKVDFQYVQISDPPPGDPPFHVTLPFNPEFVAYEGTIATLRQGTRVIGRALIHDGSVTIVPDAFIGEGELTVALEADGFISANAAVAFPNLIR